MTGQKRFSLAMSLLPWLTVPFMGKRSFFRYLPVVSFSSLFLSVFSVMANNEKWWKTKNPLSPGYVDFTYILGPFFVVLLWVFKLTYGNFAKYISSMLLLDFLNITPFVTICKRIGIFQFKRMQKSTYFIFSIVSAILLYVFQYWADNFSRGSMERGNEE